MRSCVWLGEGSLGVSDPQPFYGPGSGRIGQGSNVHRMENTRDASANNKPFGDISSWRRKDEGTDPFVILQPYKKFVKSNIGV
jgi:hypothetical protein